MLDKLFKKLRKVKLFGWYRGGDYPVPNWGGRGRRWVDEELSIARWGNTYGGPMTTTESLGSMGGTQQKDERKEVKPVEVFNELTAEKPNLDMSNLDEKIKAMKKRADFMTDELGIPANEEKNVISWLEARRKAVKAKLVDKFVWPVTTTDRIADLLKKYKLQQTTFMQYSLAVPNEAIDEMEKYVELCRKVTKDEPEFVLIIEDTPVQKTKHRDPIIVATSPFGKFLHVIGAWDKEVEIMHELYFKLK